MYKRRLSWVLALIFLGACSVVLVCTWPRPVGTHTFITPPRPRPNVVLISLDTLRADHLGCYGYRKPTSPNLDRFARDSVLFRQCRAQSPWTLPSHMALLTSMLPTTNGVDNINKVLPPGLPTLATVLGEAGYKTAALVNDGQMRAHWGYARGFDLWREFKADTPQGACPHITDEALAWLKQPPQQPFFLFLHYYDAHDPYDAPPQFREKLVTTLSGQQARDWCFRYRLPTENLTDPARLADLHAAYDADIAWLDHELGRLLAALPENTLTVIFSDHGEAFEEHGWTLHGATLYDEELHVPLLVKLPGEAPKVRDVADSVMLLDVAPTILAACAVAAPGTFQGSDLSPAWGGQALPPRLIPAETKAVLEGRYQLAVTLYPLKAIYSLFDGRMELYKLPDEHTPLPATEKLAHATLGKPLRDWIEGEQYWMLHAVGPGTFDATVTLDGDRFGLFIPVGDAAEPAFPEVVGEGRELRWRVQLAKGQVRGLFMQPAQTQTALRFSGTINGLAQPAQVFIGSDQQQPAALPTAIKPDIAPLSPYRDRPFASPRTGFHVLHHRSAQAVPRQSLVRPLDEETLRQLRALGYVR